MCTIFKCELSVEFLKQNKNQDRSEQLLELLTKQMGRLPEKLFTHFTQYGLR